MCIGFKNLLFFGIFEGLLCFLLINQKIYVISLNLRVSLPLFRYLDSNLYLEIQVFSNRRFLDIQFEVSLEFELLVISHLIEQLINVTATSDELQDLIFNVPLQLG